MAGFRFKKFTINQDNCAMKVGTDGVLLGAWVNTNQTNQILDIGTGTGLISLMNGEITIDSVPTQGTTICLKLPVTFVNKQELAVLHYNWGQYTVLIVEENTVNYLFYRDLKYPK